MGNDLTEEIRKQQKILQDLTDRQRLIERMRNEQNADRLKKSTGVAFYRSSDYAGLSCKKYLFYYGYEYTECPYHGIDKQCNCDEADWCFVVSTKNGEELYRIPNGAFSQDYTDVVGNLIKGIGIYINKVLTGER